VFCSHNHEFGCDVESMIRRHSVEDKSGKYQDRQTSNPSKLCHRLNGRGNSIGLVRCLGEQLGARDHGNQLGSPKNGERTSRVRRIRKGRVLLAKVANEGDGTRARALADTNGISISFRFDGRSPLSVRHLSAIAFDLC
jgi:hypothetical protein